MQSTLTRAILPVVADYTSFFAYFSNFNFLHTHTPNSRADKPSLVSLELHAFIIKYKLHATPTDLFAFVSPLALLHVNIKEILLCRTINGWNEGQQQLAFSVQQNIHVVIEWTSNDVAVRACSWKFQTQFLLCCWWMELTSFWEPMNNRWFNLGRPRQSNVAGTHARAATSLIYVLIDFWLNILWRSVKFKYGYVHTLCTRWTFVEKKNKIATRPTLMSDSRLDQQLEI